LGLTGTGPNDQSMQRSLWPKYARKSIKQQTTHHFLKEIQLGLKNKLLDLYVLHGMMFIKHAANVWGAKLPVG
jgi:hypothetical protein